MDVDVGMAACMNWRCLKGSNLVPSWIYSGVYAETKDGPVWGCFGMNTQRFECT